MTRITEVEQLTGILVSRSSAVKSKYLDRSLKEFLRQLVTSNVFEKGRSHGLDITTQFLGDKAVE